MTLNERGKFRYGDCQADIRDELLRYSKINEYAAHHFADATCTCGGNVFRLSLDDTEGVAIRVCTECNVAHSIGDSGEFLMDADAQECACPCGGEDFEITAGLSLYEGSEDVRWFYLGCRCPKCGLTAVYGDWKNEFRGYQELLRRV